MIVVIDYGMGNLGSIANMLKKVGASALVSGRREDVEGADKLVLPGVGAFDNGMRNIRERGLLEALHEKVIRRRTPILGICLGMQLLTRSSEEGQSQGLGWLDAETIRFAFPPDSRPPLKIPHMGWNTVQPISSDTLFAGMPQQPRFYFVHSYHVVCRQAEDVLARAQYGFQFCAALRAGHIFGVQFHPEKSHKFGMQLLRNFAGLAIC